MTYFYQSIFEADADVSTVKVSLPFIFKSVESLTVSISVFLVLVELSVSEVSILQIT